MDSANPKEEAVGQGVGPWRLLWNCGKRVAGGLVSVGGINATDV